MKRLIIALIFLTIFSITVFAHEEETPSFVVDGYKIELLQPLENVSVGTDTSLEFRIESTATNQIVSGLRTRVVFDSNIELNLQDRGDGTYYAIYKFPREGTFEIHRFMINEQSFSVDFHMKATGTSIDFTNYAFIAIPILGLIGAIFFFAKQKNWKRAAASIIISLILTGLGYSLNVYYSQGANQGILVCDPNNPTDCVYQAHIHAYIIPEVCGVERRYPTEVGALSGSHTHEEKNVAHWHDRLPYDSTTNKILNTTSLTLGAFFDAINITFTDTGFYEYPNGDTCPDGKVGTLKVFANTENYWTKNSQWKKVDPREYVWSDRDIIYIAFDNRSDQEVQNFLATSRFTFPGIGPTG